MRRELVVRFREFHLFVNFEVRGIAIRFFCKRFDDPLPEVVGSLGYVLEFVLGHRLVSCAFEYARFNASICGDRIKSSDWSTVRESLREWSRLGLACCLQLIESRPTPTSHQLLLLVPNCQPVTADLPADVRAVLEQLFAEAETAFRDGEPQVALSAVDTASTVARYKLPEGDLRAHLLHGCEQVEAATADENGTVVAAEYVAAMARRLADATES